jgi:HEPN domain-containing protein
MQTRDEVSYRLALAEGFLSEAEQDLTLKRWRSCVDNAQLVVENAGKAVLALFGVTPKTHDPAREIATILRTQPVSDIIQQKLKEMLPDLLALGMAEHFLTDYGDEASYTLPWDLFTEESAIDALAAARRSIKAAKNSIEAIKAWQKEQSDKD